MVVMLDIAAVDDFLAQRRIAVVGVSRRPSQFATTIWRELRARGYDAVPVGRGVHVIDGEPCFPTVTDVPDGADGVIVMVGPDAAADVVEEAAEAGIPRVWLFRGVGGAGACTPGAVAAARSHGMRVVDGACPMMFLDPVGSIHRVHRWVRRRRGALPRERSLPA